MSKKVEVTKKEFLEFIENFKPTLERNRWNEVTSYHDFSNSKGLDESWSACEEFDYTNKTKDYIFR